MDKPISLITGANGHLGNNLLRLLLSKGENVRAGVRNINTTYAFEGLNCKIVHADLTNKESLVSALQNVTNLYAVGAAYKMWSKNPKKDIYDVNVKGTQYLFEAAAQCGVKNIVYVSSIAALDLTKLPASEKNGYNKDRRNWYYNSKNDSDKLALELGEKFNIRTVLVLPSAMIGSIAYKLNYSNYILLQIINGKFPINTNISLNWIDVKDVAWGAYQAMKKGKNGERYILANEKHTPVQECIEIASELYPELKIKIPKSVPKWMLYSIAGLMEMISLVTGKEPLLQRHYISMFYGLKQDFNISKAKKEFGFNPKPPQKALINAFKYLKEDWQKNIH